MMAVHCMIIGWDDWTDLWSVDAEIHSKSCFCCTSTFAILTPHHYHSAETGLQSHRATLMVGLPLACMHALQRYSLAKSISSLNSACPALMHVKPNVWSTPICSSVLQYEKQIRRTTRRWRHCKLNQTKCWHWTWGFPSERFSSSCYSKCSSLSGTVVLLWF